MSIPEHQILVCASFRAAGAPQGICHKKGALGLLGYLETELSDRGLTGVSVASTGCLKFCDKGPVLVVQPENWWYGGVDEAAIDEILDGLEAGQAPSSHRIS